MKLTPLRILAIGWGGFLLYAYPGYLDTPAGDMLLDARAAQFGDWGSPIMARVWWLLGLVIGGPPGMLILQSLLFLGGVYCLLRRTCPDRTAALVAAGVLVFPPVLAIEAVICVASVFAGFALAGTALVTSTFPRRKFGGLALLLVACDLHPAAPFAVFPLVVLGLEWRPGMRPVLRYAIAVVAFAAVLTGSIALENSIVQLRSYRKEVALAKHDIKGIAYELRASHDPRIVELLKLRPSIGSEHHRDTLLAARRELIELNTGAYVDHRLRHLRRLLLSTSKLQTSFVEYADHANVLGYRARHSAIQRALIYPVRLLSKTPLFWPILYLVAGLGVIVFTIIRRQRIIAMLVASGLTFELASAVFTSTTELEHSHWLVVTAVLGSALLWVALRHRDDRAHRPLEVDADGPAVPVE